MEELGSTYLSHILKDLEFSSMYGATVRLCPVINRTQTESTKERIRKCQALHKMTLFNTENAAKQVIDTLDI
eukprot:10594112-Ditylum_brightwellii.AAC.1